MKETLRTIVFICLALVPFVAWVVNDGALFDIPTLRGGDAGMFFPFISGKNIFFRLLVEVAFVAWAALAFRYKEYRPKKSPVLTVSAIFLVVLFLANLFGVDQSRSFFSNFERMEGFIAHMHLFGYFFILYSMLRVKEEWLRLVPAFVVSNVLVMLYAFFQILGSPVFIVREWLPSLSVTMERLFPIHMSQGRLDATLGNSAYYGIYCVFFAFLYAFLAVRTEKGARVFMVIMGILNLFFLYHTATRGSILGLIVGIVLAAGLALFFGKGLTRKVGGAIVAATAALLLIFVLARETTFVKESPVLSRFANIGSNDITTGSRFMVWKMSYEGFKERPILGYGQDNFMYIFAKHHDPGMYAQEPWFDRSHNVFFDWLVAGGALGLASYLALFLVGLFILWRTNMFSIAEKSIFTGLLAAYFIHNFFVFDNLVSYILFFTVLAFIATHDHRNHGVDHTTKSWFFDKLYLESVVWIAIFLLFIFAVYKPYTTNRGLISALNVQTLMEKHGSDLSLVIKEQIEIYKRLLAVSGPFSGSTVGRDEVKEQLVQSVLQMYRIDANQMQGESRARFEQSRQDFAEYAVSMVEGEVKRGLNDARALEIYGSFYMNFGKYAEALPLLEKAHDLAPNRQRTSFQLMQAYLGSEKSVEAYELAKKTYTDEPRYEDAMKIYLTLAARFNKLDEAQKLLSKNNQVIPYVPEFSRIFSGSNDKAAVLAYLNALNTAYPKERGTTTKMANDFLQTIK